MENQDHSASIEQFKSFVKKHPKLIQEVRQGKNTWKAIYQDWYILGEDDEMWEPYTGAAQSKATVVKQKKPNPEFMNQMMTVFKNIDMNQLQYYISNLSGAVANIQQLMEQFQGAKTDAQKQPQHPFHYKKD